MSLCIDCESTMDSKLWAYQSASSTTTLGSVAAWRAMEAARWRGYLVDNKNSIFLCFFVLFVFTTKKKHSWNETQGPNINKSLVQSFSFCFVLFTSYLSKTVVPSHFFSVSLFPRPLFLLLLLLLPCNFKYSWKNIDICLLEGLKYIIFDHLNIWNSLSTSSFGHQGINFSASHSLLG